MVEKTGRESQGEDEDLIEATDDALVIAGAIHALAEAFVKVAVSISKLADAQSGEESIDEPETYLDGSLRV